MIGKQTSNRIYFYLLVFIAISLPLSKFTLSLSIIFLFLFWIVEGNLKQKFNMIVQRRSIIVFISIFFLHLLGLLWTTDFDYAFGDIKVKLPLLILPVVLGTRDPLTSVQIKALVYFFVAAVFVSSLISVFVLFGYTTIEVLDPRDISIFVSHIRFAILVTIAIFSAFYILVYQYHDITKTEKYFIGAIITWLSVFLILLKSSTGIVIFLSMGYVTLIILAGKFKNVLFKRIFRGALLVTPVIVIFYLVVAISAFYDREKVDFSMLEKRTVNNNFYNHYQDRNDYENGYYVWKDICYKELENEWNKRSEFDYKGKDKKEQNLKHTLIRYLTSKGYSKDSTGIASLSDKDVKNIEGGLTNYIFANQFRLYPKIYESIWEIDQYMNGGNPSGHSITQRFEYIKTAMAIIKNHFWIGTGTGDVKLSYEKKYDNINSELSDEWRLRAHNQYITFFLTFGVIGFIWISFAVFYSVYYENKWKEYLFIMAFVIFGLSMLNEDTLETHVGVSMVAFFFSLFLFGIGNKNEKVV